MELGDFLNRIVHKHSTFIGGGVCSERAYIKYANKQRRDSKRRGYKLKKVIERLKKQL